MALRCDSPQGNKYDSSRKEKKRKGKRHASKHTLAKMKEATWKEWFTNEVNYFQNIRNLNKTFTT